MAHLPVNHPLRPTYRVLAALAGLYVLLFGVVGFVQTAGVDTFGRADTTVLGLRTNPAFSLASAVAGVAILLALLIGRNVDHLVNLWGGSAFLLAGVGMMGLLGTDANIVNFSMATCVASLVIGLVLLVAGLYGRTSPVALARSD